MSTPSERRRKKREHRAASRRLPPVHVPSGARLQTGGRARPARWVGVGQFAQGVARRNENRRQTHGLRRVGSVITGALVTVLLVLWIVARVAHHL